MTVKLFRAPCARGRNEAPQVLEKIRSKAAWLRMAMPSQNFLPELESSCAFQPLLRSFA